MDAERRKDRGNKRNVVSPNWIALQKELRLKEQTNKIEDKKPHQSTGKTVGPWSSKLSKSLQSIGGVTNEKFKKGTKKTNKGTGGKSRKKGSQTAQESHTGARKRAKCHMTSDVSASRTGSQEKEKTACTENRSINELFQTASNSFKKTKKAKKDSNSRKGENMKTTKSNGSNGTDTSRKIYHTPVSNSNKEPFDSSCISGPSLLVKGSEMFKSSKSDIRKRKREPVEKLTREHKDVECSTDSSQVFKSSKSDVRKRKREPIDKLTREHKDVECSTDSSQVFKSSKYDVRKRKREPIDKLTREHKDVECSTDSSQVFKSSNSDVRKRKREPIDRLTREHKDIECSTDSSQVFKSSKSDIRKRKREPTDNLTNQCEDSTNIVQKSIHPLGGTQIREDSLIEKRFEIISSDKFMTNDNRPIKRFKKDDFWFDDADVEILSGQIVARQRTVNHYSKVCSTQENIVAGQDTRPGRYIAMDCEMVGGGQKHCEYSMLARCSIVNNHGNVIYDKYVKPMDTIVNFRTRYSGITPKDLRNAIDFSLVQKEVSQILKDRILIGHSIHNDLKVLFLSHPKRDIRDTANYKPFKKVSQGKTPSLKKLANNILGLNIQQNTHDSVEDACIAMKLYQLHKREWETEIKLKERRILKRQRPDLSIKQLKKEVHVSTTYNDQQRHQSANEKWKRRKLSRQRRRVV